MDQAGFWFASLDKMRRLQGKALERMGYGPDESGYRILYARPGLRLRCYGGQQADGPALLIVPAPIKRPYIWDLSPQCSVVRQAVRHGFQVYMAEWTETAEQGALPGLAGHAGPMLDEAVSMIAQHARQDRVCVAGHSLGGVLAALYAAYRPARVAGLVLIDVPLHFVKGAGAFTRLLALNVPAHTVLPASKRIPGSYLSLISAGAAPATFCMPRYLDYLASAVSRELFRTHCQVERWAMDEFSMPRKLFEDVVEQLYRRDLFMRGEMMIGTSRLCPQDIKAPLFTVYEPASSLIPPESVIAFQHAAGSAQKALLPYPGDIGVALQHVGGLVGQRAHHAIWPRIFTWLRPGLAFSKQIAAD